MIGPNVVWWVLIAACVLVLPVVLRLTLLPGKAQRDRQLNRMRSLAPAETASQRLLLKALDRENQRTGAPFLSEMDRMTTAAQLSVTGRTFVLLSLGGGVAVGMLAGVLSGSGVVAIGLGGLVALAPVAILRARHAKRVEAFALQLPDALDLMMRGLRIGHPISATIANVGRTMPDPIGAEFRIIAQKIDHGDFLTNAFSDLAQSLNQEDMHYLAVSIRIQHGTGGNLADMLGTLSKVIRSRIMLRRRVRALSSEGRISSLLLSSLPLVIYAGTSFLAPDYYGAVQDSPMFLPIACVIVALVVGNFVILRRLVNFQA